jgi:hypothetical protein
MNIMSYIFLKKPSRLLWSCLWAIPICLLLFVRPALAVDINFGDSCDPSDPVEPINLQVDVPIPSVDEAMISVAGAAGNVIWNFDSVPTDMGCTLASDDRSFTCNGITVVLPGAPLPTDDPSTPFIDETVEFIATPDQDVMVSGSPSGEGDFDFRINVTSVDTLTDTGCRSFQLSMVQPFDLSFVLDRSISMNRNADPSDPASLSRWEALRTAVRESTTLATFINDLIQLPAPANSRLGLTIFGDGVLNESFNIPEPIDGNLEMLVETAIAIPPSLPTGWFTRMGPGIQDAESKLDDCSRKRLIVLFTDGQQNPPNDPNLVADDGQTYLDGDPINATCTAAADNPIEIVSVGILQPSSEYADLLQTLAVENGLHSAIFTTTGLDFSFDDGSAVTFDSALEQAIVQALSGSSPQIVAQEQRYQRENGDVVFSPVTLNRKVRQLIFKLSFEQELSRSSLDKLLTNVQVFKNGKNVTRYFQPTVVGDTAKTVWLRSQFKAVSETSNLPPISPEGDYQLFLSRTGNFFAEPLSARLVSIADDSSLDMAWSVSPNSPRTNRAFSPTVELKWQGQPITNAKVQVSILRPGDDLGDLLARTSSSTASQRNLAVATATASQSDLTAISPVTAQGLTLATEEISLGNQKYLDLLRNPDFIRRLKPNEQTLNLSYQGEGIYSTAYNPGDISGVYQVRYQVIAEDPRFGKIERQAVQSVYVNPAPISLDLSTVKTLVDLDGTITTVFRPVTEDGKFIGPGQASSFNVQGLASAQISEGAKQDGTYEIRMKPKQGVDPKRVQGTVSFRGQETYRGVVTNFEARPGIITRFRDRFRNLGGLRRTFQSFGQR